MFEHHFIVRGKDISTHARHLLSGLLSKQRRKNIECIEADVDASDYQAMQHLVSESPWSHQAVMAQVAQEAEASLGRHRDTALFFDESSFPKKGECSVGVQRQYCGRLGKTENCQVAVFMSLCRGERVALTDFRLFLSESWAADKARCDKAKVPQDQRKHYTKTELAMQMLLAARASGSTHQWIGGDEVYGNNQEFCAQMEDLGECFLMDVAHSTNVWLADPRPKVPASTSGKGRPRTASVATNSKAKEMNIKALVDAQFAKNCRMVNIRKTTQGMKAGNIWVREVWLWDGNSARARRRLLVVREEGDNTFKYSLSNAPSSTTWERLAYMQAQRFWIEEAFKEGKSELGMADYEVRGWTAWHHHMALVCMALLFTTRERLANTDKVPLLSARDVVELLDFYLPRRERTEKEVMRQMKLRHKRRTQAIKSHTKRTRKIAEQKSSKAVFTL